MSIGKTAMDFRNAARTITEARGSSILKVFPELMSVRSRYGIGPFYFSLFSLNGAPPKDWGEYVIHDKMNPVQRRWNPSQARLSTEDKPSFYRRCERVGLPVPAVLGVISNGKAATEERIIQTTSDLEDAIERTGSKELFFKLSHGMHGDGAFPVLITGKKFEFAGRTGTADDLMSHARTELPDDQMYIVQPRLRNVAALAPLMSQQGLGTVRVVTTFVDGKCELLAACVRLTVGSNVTDNFSAGTAGNIAVPIDATTGRLGRGVWSLNSNWPDMHDVNTHPETGETIEGFELPAWQEIVELAKRGHEEFSDLGALGWDVAITDSGPVLIEANHSWDVNLMQVSHRKGFRSLLTSVMGPLDGMLP